MGNVLLDNYESVATQYEVQNAFVLVKRIEREDEMTSGGIVKPDIAKQRSQEGIVIVAGPGEYQNGCFIPVTIQAGDMVLFTKFGGTPVELDGEKFELVHIKQIYLKKLRT